MHWGPRAAQWLSVERARDLPGVQGATAPGAEAPGPHCGAGAAPASVVVTAKAQAAAWPASRAGGVAAGAGPVARGLTSGCRRALRCGPARASPASHESAAQALGRVRSWLSVNRCGSCLPGTFYPAGSKGAAAGGRPPCPAVPVLRPRLPPAVGTGRARAASGGSLRRLRSRLVAVLLRPPPRRLRRQHGARRQPPFARAQWPFYRRFCRRVAV